MPTTMTHQWLNHTKAKPCPICGKGSRCRYTEDGAHRCFRAAEPPPGWKLVKRCKDQTGIYRVDPGKTTPNGSAPPRSAGAARQKNKSVIDWAVEAAQMTATMPPECLQQLATTLGVSIDGLQAIGCGWAEQHHLLRLDVSGKDWHVDYPGGAWSFPERDAEFNVIGIAFRAVDGRKGAPKGAKRGLIIPTTFSGHTGLVPVVEGASDVAAFLTMGIEAVGRPSNSGGGALLTALLLPCEPLIVGENDERLADGGTMLWPGLHGAYSVARTMACGWKRPVRMTLPPKPAKDIRAWFNQRQPDVGDAEECAIRGRELLEVLQTASQEVPPKPPELTILVERSPNTVRANVFAAVDGRTIHVDEIKPTSAKKRKQFAEAIVAIEPSITIEDVEAKLLDSVVEPHEPPASKPEPESPESLLAKFDEETDAFLDALPSRARADAEAFLNHPRLINEIVRDIALMNVVGEEELALTIYMIGVSRLLTAPDLPLAGITQGLSSSGKSYVCDRVSLLFPEHMLLRCTDMTPQALFYLPSGRLIHRWVVSGERSRKQDDERAEATRALREMISSGHLSKAVPVKIGGRMETLIIKQDGPIAFTETTTLTRIFDEDSNRCLLLGTDESPEQTRRIMSAVAAVASGLTTNSTSVVQRHNAVQCLLKRVTVHVPFAERLADAMPSERPEARRAFGQSLQTVKSVALIHQRQRLGGVPRHGDVIVATRADYLVARRLLLGPMARALGGALPAAVANLARRLMERYDNQEFTTTQAYSNDKVIKSRGKMGEHLRALETAGVIEEVEHGKGPTPSIWRVIGEPPAPGALWLPDGEALGDIK